MFHVVLPDALLLELALALVIDATGCVQAAFGLLACKRFATFGLRARVPLLQERALLVVAADAFATAFRLPAFDALDPVAPVDLLSNALVVAGPGRVAASCLLRQHGFPPAALVHLLAGFGTGLCLALLLLFLAVAVVGFLARRNRRREAQHEHCADHDRERGSMG